MAVTPGEAGARRAEVWARLARAGFTVARALPRVRMTRSKRRFGAAKTGASGRRMGARHALPRAMWRGIGWARWN